MVQYHSIICFLPVKLVSSVSHCIQFNRKETVKGYILPSLLMSLLLGLLVLTMVLSISVTAYIWAARLDDSIAMIEDGRYTRRAIVGHIIWNSYMVSVHDSNTSLFIHDDKKTTFVVKRRALYRQLHDGSLQPLSGSRILGTVDKRKLDSIKPFYIGDDKDLHLSWTINNRFVPSTTFAQGYGGIARYEVNTAISTHYDWFKNKKT